MISLYNDLKAVIRKHPAFFDVFFAAMGFLIGIASGLYFGNLEHRSNQIFRSYKLAADINAIARNFVGVEDSCAFYVRGIVLTSGPDGVNFVAAMINTGTEGEDSKEVFARFRSVATSGIKNEREKKTNDWKCLGSDLNPPDKEVLLDEVLLEPTDEFNSLRKFIHRISNEFVPFLSRYEAALTPWQRGAVDNASMCVLMRDLWSTDLDNDVAGQPNIRRVYPAFHRLISEATRGAQGARIATGYYPALTWFIRDGSSGCQSTRQ